MARFIDRFKGALDVLGQKTSEQPSSDPSNGIPAMLGAIGPALLAASNATSDVEATLRELARASGRPDLRVYVLPTLVLVEDPNTSPAQTFIYPAGQDALRLDQAGDVERVVRETLQGDVQPTEVVGRINEIEQTPPRFGAVLSVLGHALLTVGFGLVLNPTLSALPVYVLLGLIVGTVVRLGSRFATLSLILPVFTAFAVTLVVSLLIHPFVHDDVLRLVAPALVSFLPGLTLTIAAVELTSGQVIAGASRLVYGIARLGLLAFGVYAAITVAGTPSTDTSAVTQLGDWAPWVGIALVSLGYYLYSAAPRGSLLWILYALVIAYAAQLLGDMLVGAELSGLIGAVIVVPAVYLAGRLRAAPPTAIMLTCAYWLLVPGSMGFIGLSEAASGASGAMQTILQTFGSLIAIAIGMLLGAGLSRDFTAATRAWRNPPTPDASAPTP